MVWTCKQANSHSEYCIILYQCVDILQDSFHSISTIDCGCRFCTDICVRSLQTTYPRVIMLMTTKSIVTLLLLHLISVPTYSLLLYNWTIFLRIPRTRQAILINLYYVILNYKLQATRQVNGQYHLIEWSGTGCVINIYTCANEASREITPSAVWRWQSKNAGNGNWEWRFSSWQRLSLPLWFSKSIHRLFHCLWL